MPVILNIETSTEVCSVALTCDGQVVFNRENYKGLSHASSLGGYVQEALEAAKESHLTLDAVAVSRGPGSYTGLRIGVSEAKGLCFGLDVPLIAVDTLAVMACAVMFKKTIDEEALLCPMIDARRMEVYSAVYDRALQAVKPVSAEIITETSYADILQEKSVLFFGNGAEKCRPVITHANAHFIDDIHPLAADMLALSERSFRNATFEDVAYFEPFYLKEFIATKPKNKVLSPTK
ncbi:MAG: tRNA (adenosine(37)-N6)-threonylcarbamoyltransferase complex dimerization subunit type 1 TsaB [Porphyromonadaceae bacterium]|nr:tRNA (adenosine(37)-N6)-threonylcarbamoyltransferase complex dimerization subunit type 1 TsaB [Porphyromonadaceae bacterium]